MRSTGKLHLGHLFGTLHNWVDLQEKHRCYFFAADWHALTSDYADPSRVTENTIEALADWIAAGVDPEKSVIFVQSMVPEHAELHLLLSMITPLGWLERVPTYKDQIREIENRDLNTYGFLGYPVLQTSDIILYRAQFVPVGEDQASHLELSREITRRFNSLYGNVFPEPRALFTRTPKVPGLDGRKMSKSYDNAINLSDPPEVVRQKCMTMFTDPTRVRRSDPGHPESCNLFEFHRLLSPPDLIARVESECRAATIGCVPGQEAPRRADHRAARTDQRRRNDLLKDRGTLLSLLRDGSARARERAQETMAPRPSGPRSRLRPPPATGDPVSPAPAVSRLLPEAWRVHLPVFDGPLDLLLHLIKLNEVEITDIPVATICDQFHEYLRLMEEMDLDIAGEYIYEAALLIQIKSRMLLPRPKKTNGELVEEDPRGELVQRLLEYRRIKEAAQALAEVDRMRLGLWARRKPAWEEDEGEEVDLDEVSLFDLLSAFRGGSRSLRPREPRPDPAARRKLSGARTVRASAGDSQRRGAVRFHSRPAEPELSRRGDRRFPRGSRARAPPAGADSSDRERRHPALPDNARSDRRRSGECGRMISRADLEAALEAVLFAAAQPVPIERLTGLFDGVAAEDFEAALAALRARYQPEPGRGLFIEEVAGGLRIVTAAEYHGYLKKFFDAAGGNKLSMAAIETLAIVAYRQPVTAPEVQEMRGKQSQAVIRNCSRSACCGSPAEKRSSAGPFSIRRRANS